MIELTKWSIFLQNYSISAILLANLKSAESGKGFKVYLLGQNLQLLAVIIILWRIFVFWHVDQSHFSIQKTTTNDKCFFLATLAIHQEEGRGETHWLIWRRPTIFENVLEILCVLKVTHLFFSIIYLLLSFCLA